MSRTVAPYGSWESPLPAAAVGADVLVLSQVQFAVGRLYWLELRPSEAGRQLVVSASMDGTDLREETPAEHDVRTRVHEYGGGDYTVTDTALYYVNFEDQRLYRKVHGRSTPEPLTPLPPEPAGWRYADMRVDEGTGSIYAVRERHDRTPPDNDLVRIPADGSAASEADCIRVLAAGADFYAAPRPDPDGRRLAWLQWRHPQMPWDGTELWIARIGRGGALQAQTRIAGSADESVLQPQWSADGTLHYLSDRSGWWQLYRHDSVVTDRQLADLDGEVGGPAWFLGETHYDVLPDGRIPAILSRGGLDALLLIDSSGTSRTIPGEGVFAHVRAVGSQIAIVAGTATAPPALMLIDPDTGRRQILRSTTASPLPAQCIAVPRPMQFAGTGGETAHALYYAPINPSYEAPAGSLPPLVVMAHGGPTARVTVSYNPMVQFFTTRGIAVVDVNYGGSSGYGRRYRERLAGQWGVVDVGDCAAAARHLVEEGSVDPDRLAIRGGSGGGYTTLLALTTTNVFRVGCSFWGIADLEVLVRHMHKFEAHYFDRLVGPWPEAKALYRERSPIDHVDNLNCPVILIQGSDDPIVPPEQAELMLGALRRKRIPHAYLLFDGESHGLRRAENWSRALEAELLFYGAVLDFDPADRIDPIEVHT